LISYDVGMPPSLVVVEFERQWHLYKMVSVDGRPTVRLRQPFLSSSISFLFHFLGFCIDSLDIGKLSYVKFDPHCFHCSLFIYLFILGPFFFYQSYPTLGSLEIGLYDFFWFAFYGVISVS
jgi:hypothetical protein